MDCFIKHSLDIVLFAALFSPDQRNGARAPPCCLKALKFFSVSSLSIGTSPYRCVGLARQRYAIRIHHQAGDPAPGNLGCTLIIETDFHPLVTGIPSLRFSSLRQPALARIGNPTAFLGLLGPVHPPPGRRFAAAGSQTWRNRLQTPERRRNHCPPSGAVPPRVAFRQGRQHIRTMDRAAPFQ